MNAYGAANRVWGIVGGKGEWIWGRWLILTFVVLSAMLLGDINQFCGFRRMGEVRYARSAAVVRCAERQHGVSRGMFAVASSTSNRPKLDLADLPSPPQNGTLRPR